MAEDSKNRTDGQKITDKAKKKKKKKKKIGGGGGGKLDDGGGGGGGSVSRFIQAPKMQTAISDTTLVGGGGARDGVGELARGGGGGEGGV